MHHHSPPVQSPGGVAPQRSRVGPGPGSVPAQPRSPDDAVPMDYKGQHQADVLDDGMDYHDYGAADGAADPKVGCRAAAVTPGARVARGVWKGKRPGPARSGEGGKGGKGGGEGGGGGGHACAVSFFYCTFIIHSPAPSTLQVRCEDGLDVFFLHAYRT